MNKRTKGTRGAGSKKIKTVVIDVLERDGQLRMQKTVSAHQKIVKPIILANIQQGAVV